MPSVAQIAPTAAVDKTAELAQGVQVGPGASIAPGVIVGENCEIRANAVLCRGVRMGRDNRVFSHCILGEEPQILGCLDPDTELIIGDGNTFRENVTINRGSPKHGKKTIIGNRNYFMIGSHMGHDCEMADDCMIGNYCQIAGHNKIEDHIWISAFASSHQFTTLGRFLYAGAFSGMNYDMPPFLRVSGAYPCEIRGLNTVGLQRAGFSPQTLEALEDAYRRLFRRKDGKSLARAVEELAAEPIVDENVKHLVESLQRSMQHRLRRYREQFR